MAENKIYITHDYQTGANVKGLKLEDVADATKSGAVKFDDGRFYVNNGVDWDEVVTDESFGDTTFTTQVFDNKKFDGGTYAGG